MTVFLFCVHVANYAILNCFFSYVTDNFINQIGVKDDKTALSCFMVY